MTFAQWKQETWCADAAHRFNRPDLIDTRKPLADRFRAAVALLHPNG